MAKLVWDQTGERLYETGVKKGVLYPMSNTGTYPTGVAWNGLTSVQDSPSGADANDFYADDMKYLSIRGAEDFGYTIGAFTYPDEWAACDGSAEPTTGVIIGQQTRKAFGFSYVSAIGNDIDFDDHGYKIHLYYNSTVSPSDREYSTINDSPDPIEFSWEATATPINVTGYKPTATITIDSTKVDATKLAAFEDILYGTSEQEARLPLPDEVISLLKAD